MNSVKIKSQPADIKTLNFALNAAGMESVMASPFQAVFKFGTVVQISTNPVPVIFFDRRADPSQIVSVVLALQGVGSWSVSSETLLIEKTPNGYCFDITEACVADEDPDLDTKKNNGSTH